MSEPPIPQDAPVPEDARVPEDHRPARAVVPSTAAGGAGRGESRPSRPPVSVTPMRAPVPDDRPRAVDVAGVLWAIAVLGLVVMAAMTGARQTAVRTALRRSLTAEHPDTRASDIGSLVDIALLVSAGLALVIALLALYGSLRLRQRMVSGRGVLTTMAVLTVVGSVAFWDVIGPARDELNTAANILPFVIAVLAAAATACAFAPDVGRWLRSAPTR